MSKLDDILEPYIENLRDNLGEGEFVFRSDLAMKQQIKDLFKGLVDDTLAERADVRRLRQKIEEL